MRSFERPSSTLWKITLSSTVVAMVVAKFCVCFVLFRVLFLVFGGNENLFGLWPLSSSLCDMFLVSCLLLCVLYVCCFRKFVLEDLVCRFMLALVVGVFVCLLLIFLVALFHALHFVFRFFSFCFRLSFFPFSFVSGRFPFLHLQQWNHYSWTFLIKYEWNRCSSCLNV